MRYGTVNHYRVHLKLIRYCILTTWNWNKNLKNYHSLIFVIILGFWINIQGKQERNSSKSSSKLLACWEIDFPSKLKNYSATAAFKLMYFLHQTLVKMKFWHRISMYRILTDGMKSRIISWKPLKKRPQGFQELPWIVTAGGAPPTVRPDHSLVHDCLGIILDSLNKQLSSAYCLPGPGTDPGYTKMSKAQSPSLKISQSCGWLLSTLQGGL